MTRPSASRSRTLPSAPPTMSPAGAAPIRPRAAATAKPTAIAADGRDSTDSVDLFGRGQHRVVLRGPAGPLSANQGPLALSIRRTSVGQQSGRVVLAAALTCAPTVLGSSEPLSCLAHI